MQPVADARPTTRKKLAIVSSWNENCGNASYTYALKREFEKYYDVEILALDLFILQKSTRSFRQLADRHIDGLADRLKDFDYVNIQFEAGLYGATISSMRRRVFKLIDGAPNLILTMHRLDVDNESLIRGAISSVRRLSITPFRKAQLTKKFSKLYLDIVKRCRERSRAKNVWIKVHTKRERRLIQEAFQFENCLDYPLAFLDVPDRDRIIRDVRKDEVLRRFELPADAKTIGAFGYISDYKGFETLIKAVSILPPEWYLLIVGSQHPQSIRPWTDVDPYLAKLLKEIEEGSVGGREIVLEDLLRELRATRRLDDVQALRGVRALRGDGNHLRNRVRFVGNVNDDDFTFLLRNTDAVVLPYQEVGQSMSGVVALALEAGARLFCSNTLSFSEAKRYYGNVFTSFDIGNYAEISQKIRLNRDDYDVAREEAYAKYNIVGSVAAQRDLFEKAQRVTR